MQKNYIIIANDGIIPIELMTLLGPSVPGPGNICEFGNGLKMAMAASLRLKLDMRILTGSWKYTISTDPVQFHHYGILQEFNTVSLIGKKRGGGIKTIKTGFTPEIAKDWNSSWHIIREVMANAIDRPGFSWTASFVDVHKEQPDDKNTRIFIECDEEANYVVRHMAEFVRLTAEGLLPTERDFPPRIGPHPIIYRKGIRVCTVNNDEPCDYEIPDLPLTVDRTPKSAIDLNRIFDESVRMPLTVYRDENTGNVVLWLPANFPIPLSATSIVKCHRLPDRAILYFTNSAGQTATVIIHQPPSDVHVYHETQPRMGMEEEDKKYTIYVNELHLEPGTYQAVVA